MEASIIVTYRCPMKCKMCNIWKNPTNIDNEFKPEILKKLPKLRLVNLTGGEPTLREDLEDIIEILYKKTDRVVISTSGWLEERVIALGKKYPKIGFRISIEGLSCKNDDLRGREGGFDRGLRCLLELKRLGLKDIGFGITVSDSNSKDMLMLYELAKNLGLEFATAALHNSFYFHKDDNRIREVERVCADFEELANRLLSEKKPKSWFRAYFNMGLINYIQGNERLLPCMAGSQNFFVDPYGEVLPCNGMEAKYWFDSFGNLNHSASFEELWFSSRAEEIRRKVRECPKKYWMIGSASPAIKKNIFKVANWVIKEKCRNLVGKRIDKATDFNLHLL